MLGLQPTATSIQCRSKLQRSYLDNEKQHISKNGSISKQNEKRPEQVKNIVGFVNKLILEEYTEILVSCGYDVCLIGLFRIRDSGLSIKNTSYCCNVCNETFIVKKNILAVAIDIYNY